MSLIVETHRASGSFEATVARFDMLTPDQVRAALDYYAAHPERVDEDIERNAADWKALKRRPWPA